MLTKTGNTPALNWCNSHSCCCSWFQISWLTSLWCIKLMSDGNDVVLYAEVTMETIIKLGLQNRLTICLSLSSQRKWALCKNTSKKEKNQTSFKSSCCSIGSLSIGGKKQNENKLPLVCYLCYCRCVHPDCCGGSDDGCGILWMLWSHQRVTVHAGTGESCSNLSLTTQSRSQ